MKLYHYTNLESFWKIWVTKELLFCKSRVPSNNDFFERNKSISFGEDVDPVLLTTEGKKSLARYFKVLSQFKQISLTKDYMDGMLGCLSPMMWGQYADKGKGVCIELDANRLPLSSEGIYPGDIIYNKEFNSFVVDEVALLNASDMDDYIISNLNSIFFQKHIHWFYENEYRIISKQSGLDISDAISRIVVPSYDGMTSKLVRKLVNNDNLISFLMMEETNGIKKLSCFPFTINKNKTTNK